MIYELLYPLRHDAGWLRWLNVLRYVPFRVIAATMTAMLLSFFVSPWFIRALKRKQIGQVVREDGPHTHLVKSGTPTMGGALILVSVLVPTILWCDPHNVFVWATAAVTAGYGVIGYLDDYLKIKLKNSRGMPGRYKLLGQFLIGGGVRSGKSDFALRLARRLGERRVFVDRYAAEHGPELPQGSAQRDSVAERER